MRQFSVGTRNARFNLRSPFGKSQSPKNRALRQPANSATPLTVVSFISKKMAKIACIGVHLGVHYVR